MLQDNPASEDCRVMEFKQPIIDHILADHVIKSLQVKSETGCEAYCFEDNDCMSVNLGPPLEDGKHLCELSSSDHNLNPGDLKSQENFIYKPVWVSISVTHCKCHIVPHCKYS